MTPCTSYNTHVRCQRDGTHDGWHAWYSERTCVAWRGDTEHEGDQYVLMTEALLDARRKAAGRGY